MPDLFNKLTLDLQQTVLPVFTTVQILKELTDQCLAINQSLHQIKTHAKQYKARNPLNQTTSNIKTANSAPIQATTPTVLTIQPAINPATSYTASPATGLIHTQPTYSNSYRQALSN